MYLSENLGSLRYCRQTIGSITGTGDKHFNIIHTLDKHDIIIVLFIGL